MVQPKGLESIEFGPDFNQPLVSPGAEGDAPLGRRHALPAGLKHLPLDNSLNHPLSGYELPDGLEVLGICASYDFMSFVRWPSGLEELYLGDDGNDDRLICGNFVRSTLPIGLPPNLTLLEFGNLFNSPLTTVAFPPTLRVLEFGHTFNHPIGRDICDVSLLPEGLDKLPLGRRASTAASRTFGCRSARSPSS